jgi:N-acetyl-gamma-glutamyl-phosphate reductase
VVRRGAPHPELLDEFVYGLPELFRSTLIGASAVAVPGCYVTAASLALAPLVRNGLIEPTGIVVDAASGVSGAGRGTKPTTMFCTVDEDFTAYGLLDHRHTPEIEQNLSYAADGTALAQLAQVLFTPHLAPMNRGILATCYARPTGTSPDTAQLLELFRETYRGEQFIVVDERSPSTKATLGSNSTHLTVRYDARTGWVMAIAALDNLTKGASGQAVQCANIAPDCPRRSGSTPPASTHERARGPRQRSDRGVAVYPTFSRQDRRREVRRQRHGRRQARQDVRARHRADALVGCVRWSCTVAGPRSATC